MGVAWGTRISALTWVRSGDSTRSEAARNKESASGFTIGASPKFGAVRGRGGASRVIKSQIPPVVEETRYGRGGKPTLRGDAAQSQSFGRWPFSATYWKAEYLLGPAGQRPSITARQRPWVRKRIPGYTNPGPRCEKPRYSTGRSQPWLFETPGSCPQFDHGPGCVGRPRATRHVRPLCTARKPPRRTGRCTRSAPTERRRPQPRVNPTCW